MVGCRFPSIPSRPAGCPRSRSLSAPGLPWPRLKRMWPGAYDLAALRSLRRIAHFVLCRREKLSKMSWFPDVRLLFAKASMMWRKLLTGFEKVFRYKASVRVPGDKERSHHILTVCYSGNQPVSRPERLLAIAGLVSLTAIAQCLENGHYYHGVQQLCSSSRHCVRQGLGLFRSCTHAVGLF
jgi:hypothetical protein